MNFTRRDWLQTAVRQSALGVAAGLTCGRWASAQPEEEVKAGQFRFLDDQQREQEIFARVVVTAQDGGRLLLGQTGELWTVAPDQLRQLQPATVPWHPYSSDEFAAHGIPGLNKAVPTTATEHYLIFSNTGEPYVKWCSSLLERLLDGFYAFWKQRGWTLTDPEFPLPVVIFSQQAEYAKFATFDVGPEVATVPGYYSILSNRGVTYDLTSELRGQPARTPADVQQRMESGRFNIATVVHEATHQIAFNSGLHVRLADNPLWLTEGMAMFFETPDLRNRTGWRTAGILNRSRLERMRDYAQQRRPADSLRTLIDTDARLSDTQTAEDAYAESWALTYYLLKKQSDKYIAYVRALSTRVPLIPAEPGERLQLFEQHIGPCDDVDAQMLRYLRTLSR